MKTKMVVGFLDEDVKLYKLLEEVSMEDWVTTNKRLISEIDPEMARKYMSASWIAFRYDTALPLPVAEMILTKRGSKLKRFYADDLVGPYGYPEFDDQVVR